MQAEVLTFSTRREGRGCSEARAWLLGPRSATPRGISFVSFHQGEGWCALWTLGGTALGTLVS